jgi:hypothetical protein
MPDIQTTVLYLLLIGTSFMAIYLLHRSHMIIQRLLAITERQKKEKEDTEQAQRNSQDIIMRAMVQATMQAFIETQAKQAQAQPVAEPEVKPRDEKRDKWGVVRV